MTQFEEAHEELVKFAQLYVELNFHSLVVDLGTKLKFHPRLPDLAQKAADASPEFLPKVLVPLIEREKRKRANRDFEWLSSELERHQKSARKDIDEIADSKLAASTKKRRIKQVTERLGRSEEALKPKLEEAKTALSSSDLVTK